MLKDISTDKNYYTQKEIDEIKELIVEKWLSSLDSSLIDYHLGEPQKQIHPNENSD